MVSVTSVRLINAPQESVFQTFTDLRRAPEFIPAIKTLEVLTEGPIGKGTRWREMRVMMGKEATETMEITEFDPPRSYAVEARSHGTHYRSTFRFSPESGGTRAEMTFSGRPESGWAKALGALVGWAFKGMLRKALEADMDALKAAAERNAPGGASSLA
jgi:uncharacterized protein YndB with AHSA1/START domain